MSLQNKAQIRKNILAIRNNLPESEKLHLQNLIAKNFDKLITPIIMKKTIIATYYPVGSELDILPMLLDKLSTKLSLPVMKSSTKILEFCSWKISDKLSHSKYAKNILEPEVKSAEVIPDVVIAPLIACDIHGHRIGSGRGMYDATIAHLRAYNPNLLYVGICYDFQLLKHIPAEEHDQKLDIILTESRMIQLERA